MAWQPKQSNRFYRLVVYTGLFLSGLFRIRVLVSGQQHLPAPDPVAANTRVPRPGTGAVVVITHFGYLDFVFAEMVLWRHMKAQLRFLITKAATGHWLAGPAMHACGHVTVDRKDGGTAFQDAVAKLRAGEYVAVLPEAGVSRSFTVRRCKTGAVRMAAEARVPIIPVSVWGSHRLMSRGHRFSVARAWRAPVRVHIGAPVSPGPDIDVVEETGKLRSVLQDGIDAGIAGFPVVPPPGAWWMPSHLGGGAPTVAQQERLDELERKQLASGRSGKSATR
ncbi:MAG TPA: lysophospholipid acyltransferase family protein [Arthrobacter sp.]|nr:lysophospholipid acyltransferase family protein [Arthrobacter sp.]